jgi:co-chaperonin GroES (HSP10)
MSTVLHPKGNRITVLRDKPKDKSEGGLLLTAQIEDHEIGTVMELGPGVLRWQAETANDQVAAILNGQDIPAALQPIKPGDRVVYSRFAGVPMRVGGQEISVLMHHPDHDEIIGVLEGEGE